MRFSLLSITLCFFAGCHSTGPTPKTDLSVGLIVRVNPETQALHPHAVLIGDGHVVASNKLSWTLDGSYSDALPFSYGEGMVIGSFWSSNPYYILRGFHRLPSTEWGQGWTVDPIHWVGPRIEAETWRSLAELRVSFTLYYISPTTYEQVSKEFEWQVLPEIHPAKQILPID